MKEAKYKIIIALFVATFIMSLFLNQSFAIQDVDMTINSASKEQPKLEDRAKDLIVRPNVEYKEEEGLRDPYQSPIKEEVVEEALQEQVPIDPLPSLTIQGMVWGGTLPQAIINNKVVKIGDTIEGVRIIGIKKEGITVFFGNREYNLSSPAAVSLENFKTKPQGNNQGGNHEK